MESREKRLCVVDALLSKPGPSAALFRELKLDEVGAKACSLLLKSAIEHQQGGDWELCHEAALKAREYAWEQLHSGPSWQAVAQVHRDAYGVAGTLVAVAIFVSGATGSLDKAVYTLDLVALMAGGRFQALANLFIEHMEPHAQLGPTFTPLNSRATTPQARADGKTASHTLPETKYTLHEKNSAAAAGLVPTFSTAVGPVEPRLKKSKRGRSPAKGELPGLAGGVRRIRMPPLDVFQREYMETSTPVILTGVMDGWPAMGLNSQGSRDWSNPSYLRAVAGRRTVPVEVGGSYTSDGWRQELMTIGDFIGRFIEPKADYSSPSDTDAPSADNARTSADRVHSSADGVRSSTDRAHASADRAHSSADRAHCSGDRAHSSGDKAHSSADRAHASADRARTSADRAHSSADKVHSSADKAHSSTDKALSSADRAHSSADKAHYKEDVLDTGVDADIVGETRRSARKAGVTGQGETPRGETAYLAQHELFDQIPPLRRDIMTPDYCALLLADEEDDGGAESVATNAWFGPGGTVSPLHNDPFHNLLAQVVGSKRVLLVDRKLSASVYPRPGLMTNTSEVDAANPDLSEHPLFAEAMPLIECQLRKGEMLYIPPLFWHHIQSLEVSFSVSFWWGKRRALSDVLPEK